MQTSQKRDNYVTTEYFQKFSHWVRVRKKTSLTRTRCFSHSLSITLTLTCRSISSGDCTLQCGMWLWNRDSEFTKWQHPAMWHVAVGWHTIEFAQTSAILEFYSTYGFHFHTSLQSKCHYVPVCEILSKSDHPRQRKMTSCRFSRWRISAILDCRDPIMGSLKSPVKLT